MLDIEMSLYNMLQSVQCCHMLKYDGVEYDFTHPNYLNLLGESPQLADTLPCISLSRL